MSFTQQEIINCAKKKKFISYDEAKTFCKNYKKKYGPIRSWYKCSICDFWHTTSSETAKGRAKRLRREGSPEFRKWYAKYWESRGVMDYSNMQPSEQAIEAFEDQQKIINELRKELNNGTIDR